MTREEQLAFVDAYARAHTRGSDGWPTMWAGYIYETNASRFCVLYVDRDRSDEERGRAIATAIEAALPVEGALGVEPRPTTRTDRARAIVHDHMREWAHREADLLLRHEIEVIRFGEVEVLHRWAHDELTALMYVIDDGDRPRARAIGETWLAHIVETLPELAGMVDVSVRPDPDLRRRLEATQALAAKLR